MSVQIEVHSTQQKMQGRCSPLSSEADLSNNSEELDDLEFKGNAVATPGPHDVLLGRGGGTNNHSGNIRFRQLVNEHKIRYLACSKVDKPKVARDVVDLWRKMTPPGRFLARKDEGKRGPGSVKSSDNVWYEVADKKAREKASQCLRERTPDVLPYIKQLREQQDAITEKGVSMVQHQLQMQQRHEAQQYQAPTVGANQVVSINEHGEMVMIQQLQPQQYMEHPVQHQSGMAPTMRLTSLPEASPHPRNMATPSGYGQQRSMSIGLGTGHHHVQHGSSLQQRSMSLGHGMPSQTSNAIYMNSAGTQQVTLQPMPSSMQTGIQQVGRYHVAQNGDMAPQPVLSSQDYHHQQHVMMQQNQVQGQQQHYVMQPAQQQVLPQHNQQQQMQFQQPQMVARVPQNMQQQQFMMQSQHLQMGQMLQMPPQQLGQQAVTADALFEAEPEPYCVQSDPLFSMRIATPSRKKAPEKVSKPEEKATTKERRKGTNNAPAKAALKQADIPEKRKAPARTTTEASFMSLGTTGTADLEAGGEITIEEYRKQLQQYIESNQVKPTGENGDDADINYNSDLEDDWEKEREKNMRDDKTRGVGRNVSGMSFISSKTAKSANSMVSGISSGLFSTDISADMSEATKKGGGGTSSLNNSNRSLCSNLSLMSELTDLSENIDTLTLDD